MMRVMVLISVACLLAGSIAAQEAGQKTVLKREQAMELAKMLAREDPFLEAPDVRMAPETIGKFFKKEIYAGLKGNPFMGYYYEEGGKYLGSKQKTIWIDVLSGLETTKPYHRVIRSAMEKLAEAKGYRLDKDSPNRVGIYAIQVHPEKTKTTHPGIIAEIYIQNRENGTVLYTRQYEGDLSGPEAAIVTVCDYIYYFIGLEPKAERKRQ